MRSYSNMLVWHGGNKLEDICELDPSSVTLSVWRETSLLPTTAYLAVGGPVHLTWMTIGISTALFLNLQARGKNGEGRSEGRKGDIKKDPEGPICIGKGWFERKLLSQYSPVSSSHSMEDLGLPVWIHSSFTCIWPSSLVSFPPVFSLQCFSCTQTGNCEDTPLFSPDPHVLCLSMSSFISHFSPFLATIISSSSPPGHSQKLGLTCLLRTLLTPSSTTPGHLQSTVPWCFWPDLRPDSLQ